jgi:hypothetical protein
MLRHACGYALANKGIDTPNAAGLSWPSLDQFDHALRGAGPRPVQKHCGQGVDSRVRRRGGSRGKNVAKLAAAVAEDMGEPAFLPHFR